METKTDEIIRWINCPSCRKKITYDQTSPFRPFCSTRCKTIDIAAWASEEFRVPGEAVSQESMTDEEDGEFKD